MCEVCRCVCVCVLLTYMYLCNTSEETIFGSFACTFVLSWLSAIPFVLMEGLSSQTVTTRQLINIPCCSNSGIFLQ